MSEPFIGEKSVLGALGRAATDKKFAIALFKDPARFKAEYNLRDREIELIRETVPSKVREALDIDYE
jgi:hypothetical protein